MPNPRQLLPREIHGAAELQRLFAELGLRERAMIILEALTGPHDWVWASPHRKGKQPLWLSTIMRYYIQSAVRCAGIQKNIGWHSFRHTFSSLVKSLGVDAEVVQELVRHASFDTTMDGYMQAYYRNGKRKNNLQT